MKLLWQQIANTTITEILCDTAMDGIVLDTEHGYWNNETLVDCIRVIRLKNKMPFVRMKYNEQLVQLCVDNDCEGLIFSKIEDTIKFNIGLGLCIKNFWNKLNLIGKEVKTVAQIESGIGIYNIYNGFDYYMLGLYDLSVDVDSIGVFDSLIMKKMINKFESNILPEKRGIHLVKNINEAERYKNYGIVAYSLDTLFIIDGIEGVEKYV